MFRRFAPVTVRLAGARYLTPSEDLKKLFASDFETATYPTSIVPSDSTIFAKFLYKACEPKNNFDAVLKDFATIDSVVDKLPVFWERTASVEEIKEFKSFNPNTIFTLVWMQKNGTLEDLTAVRLAFETYVNAQKKKAVAKVFIGKGSDAKDATTEGKKVAQELHKTLADLSGFALEVKTVIDTDIVTGFAVELGGMYVNKATGLEAFTKSTSVDVDYTNVPVAKTTKTVFADNIESEVMRAYLDKLIAFDAEEAKNGV